MITDSSKNYLDGWVTLVFEGDEPNKQEITSYCEVNYNFRPKSILIEPPNKGIGGFPNPGIVKAHPNKGVFE